VEGSGMRSFQEIHAIAAERHGGAAALDAAIAQHRSRPAAELAAIPDDRWLSLASKCVFRAGFNWSVIENKWPGFEEAFHGFDVRWCALMSDEDFDVLLKDRGIVRNAQKINSVRRNGQFFMDLAAEHGSAARFFAEWPDADYAGLLEVLDKRGDRLGGGAGMMFLRFIGRSSFITSRDVAAALIREGVVDKPPSSKRDFRAVQAAFNTWAEQSGRDLTSISRTLAMSIDG
jgi:3-methyladenine DNA glycosylase Tag